MKGISLLAGTQVQDSYDISSNPVNVSYGLDFKEEMVKKLMSQNRKSKPIRAIIES